MPRYLEIAGQAKNLARELVDLVSPPEQPRAAQLIALIANLCVRACPRAVQHTVRYNIVKTVVRDLCKLVRVGMTEKEDPKTGRKYHALVTTQIVDDQVVQARAEEPDHDDLMNEA